MRFLLRRLLQGIFLLLGASVLSFALLQLAPGDFLDEVRFDPRISPETIRGLRTQYGLDEPILQRYVHWLNSIRRGDLGFSFAYNRPVSTLLWPRARNTLLLTGLATVIAWGTAIPLGIWSATRRARWVDRLFTGVTSGLLATPDILLALALVFVAARTGWFPTGGLVSPGFGDLGWVGKVRDIIAHLWLPVTALVLASLPVLVRHVRAAVTEALSAPFIRAARAHGIPQRYLLYNYALRAAANPLTSLLGLSVALLVSGSLLVEIIMSWPGMGPLLLESIMARDMYVVVGSVMFSTLAVFAGNLIADLLLYSLDPRIRIG